MGGGRARGKDWLRAWGHHLSLTDTIFQFPVLCLCTIALMPVTSQ